MVRRVELLCLDLSLFLPSQGFRTPLGFFAIVLGIHTLPLVLYLIREELFTDWWFIFLLEQTKNVCILGRLCSFYCEVMEEQTKLASLISLFRSTSLVCSFGKTFFVLIDCVSLSFFRSE